MTSTATTRDLSDFTQRLMGLKDILPVPRKPAPSLRAAENYEAVIAAHADDIASAVGAKYRLRVSFHEIAVRDTAVPETVAPRHRKAGPACSNVDRPRTKRRGERVVPFRAALGAR